jgi:hypothetical protein
MPQYSTNISFFNKINLLSFYKTLIELNWFNPVMKRISSLLISLSLVFTLSACSDTEEPTQGEYLSQTFSDFSLNVPGNWRRVNSESFANTIPQGTQVIFMSNNQVNDFIQNVNVVQESLNTDATSLEYAKANMLLGSKAIIDYRPVSSEESEISGVRTVYHVFRARNVSTDPLRFYAQSYFSRDRVGYTVTCIALDEDLAQQQTCDSIIRSFSFSS